MSMTQFAMVEELAFLVKDNLQCKHLVLEMEETFVNFLQDEDTSSDEILELEPMNSYNRLLLHRLAEIFGFAHESEGEGNDRHLILERCPDTAVPSILVSDVLSEYDQPQSLFTSHQILRREEASPDQIAPPRKSISDLLTKIPIPSSSSSAPTAVGGAPIPVLSLDPTVRGGEELHVAKKSRVDEKLVEGASTSKEHLTSHAHIFSSGNDHMGLAQTLLTPKLGAHYDNFNMERGFWKAKFEVASQALLVATKQLKDVEKKVLNTKKDVARLTGELKATEEGWAASIPEIFENIMDQVRLVAPGIDFAEVGATRRVVNGVIVDILPTGANPEGNGGNREETLEDALPTGANPEGNGGNSEETSDDALPMGANPEGDGGNSEETSDDSLSDSEDASSASET